MSRLHAIVSSKILFIRLQLPLDSVDMFELKHTEINHCNQFFIMVLKSRIHYVVQLQHIIHAKWNLSEK